MITIMTIGTTLIGVGMLLTLFVTLPALGVLYLISRNGRRD